MKCGRVKLGHFVGQFGKARRQIGAHLGRDLVEILGQGRVLLEEQSFACSTTPAINGLNRAVAPVTATSSLAVAIAAADGCWLCAAGPNATSATATAASRAARLMA